MQKALRFHQPSALGLVFVITLAVLILAGVAFVFGVARLLGVEGQGVADPNRYPSRVVGDIDARVPALLADVFGALAVID
jgi:hypothetical protein